MSTKTVDSEPEFSLDAGALEPGGEVGQRISTPERNFRPVLAGLALLVLVITTVAIYWFWPHSMPLPEQVVLPPRASNVVPDAQSERAIQHPIENIPTQVATDPPRVQSPLPGLDDSDVVARDVTEAILNGGPFVHLLVPDGIIRHIVAMVDNLPRKKFAPRILPIQPAHGSLATVGAAGGTSIAAGNAGRYAAYIEAAESIDTERLAGFYVRLYPLFQQAYVDLGYPHGYFNDRLIGVIDHLLAAPEPRVPIYLTQPRVMFEFADPDLEELSAGQKILVRVGIDNELRLKAKLREIRKMLTATTATR